MFTIIQSHRTERLVEQLLLAYQSKNQSIFEEFIVIVPSMVLGDWLDKSIASQAGISTLVTTKFWGQYQWTLMQKVLADYNAWLENTASTQEIITVPEVAVLTGAVMQWRLFGYFTYYQSNIMSDDTHSLYPLLSALLDEDSDRSQQDIRLWSLATDFSRVFSRYLTHREEWLSLWSNNKIIDVATMIAQKDELSIAFDENAGMTPEWLIAHYIELEAAQRHLWHLLFASVYEHRASIETRFWDIMTDKNINEKIDMHTILPRQLHIFTIQQLPQNELDFLQRLSSYINITLLHYNPSQLFWADIVDKQWLQRQQVINPKSVFLRDYGHTLLSRLGKQSRETFAMLANLDSSASVSGFQLDWQDRFEDDSQDFSQITTNSEPSLSLLAHLQQDVLMLDESATQQTTAGRVSAALGAQIDLNIEEDHLKQSTLTDYYSDDALKTKHNTQPNRQWLVSQYDNSLSIHSCHNLQRQLEILRGMIGRWLNDTNEDGSKRHLSDIVVLLPDVERHHDLISSVFVNGKGQDGLSLPAKVTGVVDKSIRQLWESISGFYGLLGSDTARFEAAEVLDWLMLPPLYESLGLTHEQMSRGCELLTQAGFVRGFDEAHLQQTLEAQDYDYRFSFAYALDQLALGLVMPEAGISDCLYPDQWQIGTLAEKTVPMSTIGLNDATIIEALCRVHTGLNTCRYQYQERHNAEDWLNRIESNIMHPFFGALDQTRPMRAIFNAMNGFKSSLRANRHYQRYHTNNKTENVDSHTTSNNDADVLNATQVEARLSKVSALPLKLSFMLDSIEDELESQQVSAEPTGVITFGRFGALRNVPFGLVVMLNMDLSEFPNRDRDNRYDLMKAGLAKRGDRFSEDDDNGAFLDALLCARSACWIFYNGQRLTDTHEHLPANPVSELLQFLRGEVQWQWPPLENEQYKLTQSFKHNNTVSQTESNVALMDQIQRYLPKLIDQWLITRHPALPFAEEIFIKPDVTPASDDQDEAQAMVNLLTRAMQAEKQNQRSTNAPARVWQDVFERLQEKDKMRQAMKVTLPNKAEYQRIAHRIDSVQQGEPFDTVHVDMQRLYMQVRHPIKRFLKEQQVHIVLPAEDTVYQEPLSLTGLSTYTVNNQLLSNMHIDSNTKQSQQGLLPLDRLLYDPVMPAGVLRQSTLQYQRTKIEEQCREFADQLAQLNINVQALSADNHDTLEANHNLSLLTACAEKMVTVTATGMNSQNQLQIKGIVPIHVSNDVLVDPSITIDTDIPTDKTTPELWLNILPNSARTQYLLRFWLAHVFWQVSRQTTQAQVIANHGRSIWRFNKAGTEKTKHAGATTFSLAPIVYEAALDELLKWIRFAHIAGTTPMTVLPVYAMTYLQKIDDVNNKDEEYLPKRSDFKDWLWVQHGHDVVYDTCSQHELWQYVLDKQDAFVALADALPILAKPLFGMMNEALTAL